MTDTYTMDIGAGKPFPFIEDENGNITGLGPQDKDVFAAEINRYDRWCGLNLDEDSQWTAQDIEYRIVKVSGDWLVPVNHPTDYGSFIVTTLWNCR